MNRRHLSPITPPWQWARRFVLVLLLVSASSTLSVRAVILFGSGDPAFNTTAPTGTLADSGWTLQGQWGSFLGTPIAPNLFITAKHVGGDVGGVFSFRGTNYTVIEAFADPQSDLSIFKVCGIFPATAALYSGTDEIGKSLVVFGRGTQRGLEVRGPSLLGQELKGWNLGASDGVLRWGENQVAANVPAATGLGELLVANFDATGGMNEAHLSVGDSGGAIFIKTGATWKLAGINYAVDGPFNTTNTGPGFNAAIFDEGGLYIKPTTISDWEQVPETPVNVPSAFYFTRISFNLAWVNSIIAQHAVASYPPVLESTTSLGQMFAPHPSYVVDELAKTITLTEPTNSLFLRLRGCVAYEFLSDERQGGSWILSYGP